MQYANNLPHYDVIITGAGPAGCACALALKNAGLRVAIIDKTSFPRDKVCGDAIPGRAIRTLDNIDPVFAAAFRDFEHKCDTRSAALYYKGRSMTFNWVQEAYTCARMEFDNFLFSLVKEHTNTYIYTDTVAHSFTPADDGITIARKDGKTLFHTKLLIGADGAQSQAAKQLAGQVIARDHHVGSVRAYFTNVADMDSATTEIYFDKQFLPSYLWVFPLPGNTANVGFGMLSSEIARRKVNIKKVFYAFIDRDQVLRAKFKDAVQAGPLQGFGLPLGAEIKNISGANFMLAGDAASLIDPISGDGIGNAMLSGRLAAQQAIASFKANDFSAMHMADYDKAVTAAIGKELKMRYRTQRALSRMPLLLDVAFLAAKNKMLHRLLQKAL